MSVRASAWIVVCLLAGLCAAGAEAQPLPQPEMADLDFDVEGDPAEGSDEDSGDAADAADEADEADDAKDEADDEESDLYDEATEMIDEEQWADAVTHFARVAALKGKKTDAALYWKAYAQNRSGKRTEALATLGDLKKAAPGSKWLDDARALEIEIRGASGQRVTPDAQADEDLKLMALNSLLHSDEAEALPMLEKFLSGSASVKLKKQALFVLAQSSSPRGQEIVGRVARGEQHASLQMEAVKYLGLFGGERSRQILADIYASSNDTEVRRAILHSFMLSGDKPRLLAAARGEKDSKLREAAVHQLGISGARNELIELYRTEAAVPVRKAIIHALFIAGAADQLGEMLRTEKEPVLRREVIHSLGLIGSHRTGVLLASTYRSETDPEIKKQVLHALFLQNNAKALVEIARAEKDPELRKSAVHWLSLTNAPEAKAFLMEILNR